MNRLYWKRDVFGCNVPRLPFEILGLLIQARSERRYDRDQKCWEQHHATYVLKKNLEEFKTREGF